jgi:preprotein translocase subunit SecY
MSSTPKDLTVGQLVTDAKALEIQAPAVAANADAAIQYWAQQIEDALPGTDFAVKVKQIAKQASGVETEVAKDAAAAEQVQKGLALPLAVVSGVTVKGSGQLVSSAEGLQSSMTKAQKIVSEIASYLYLFSCIATTGGTLLIELYPKAATWSIGGGVSLGLLTSAIRSKLIPALARYSDATPRAVLVQPQA